VPIMLGKETTRCENLRLFISTQPTTRLSLLINSASKLKVRMAHRGRKAEMVTAEMDGTSKTISSIKSEWFLYRVITTSVVAALLVKFWR